MELESVTFWLNAFIPDSVCETKGDLSVITVPAANGTPVPDFRFFTGDQREFSEDPDASSRMHAEVKLVDLSSERPRIEVQRNQCGKSHEVDEDGNIIASATASNERMTFLNLRGSQTVDPEGGVIDGISGSVQIDVVGSAQLPLVGLAPDIDYSGTLTIDRLEGSVLFKGAVSGFPAFEMYFKVNDGPPVTLAQLAPISPIELIGEENRAVAVSGRIVL
jgi:hypothetical protein